MKLLTCLAVLAIAACGPPNLSFKGTPLSTDVVELAVVKTTPEAGAVDVNPSANGFQIQVRFDAPLDSEKLKQGRVFLNASPLEGLVSGPVLKLSPKPLLSGTKYTVTITSGFYGKNGEKLADDFSFSFTTNGVAPVAGPTEEDHKDETELPVTAKLVAAATLDQSCKTVCASKNLTCRTRACQPTSVDERHDKGDFSFLDSKVTGLVTHQKSQPVPGVGYVLDQATRDIDSCTVVPAATDENGYPLAAVDCCCA